MKAKLKQLWEWRAVWATAPIVTAIVITLRLTGLLQGLEWAAFDLFLRQRPSEEPDPRIVIVGIGEEDLRDLAAWPMSDEVLAELIEKISAQNPRGIGLDLFRDLAVEPGHDALLEVYQSTPNLLGMEKVITDANSEAVPPPPLLAEQGQVGFVDAVLDADNRLRRMVLKLATPEGEVRENFGLKLALMYLEAEGIQPETPDADQPEHLLQLNGILFPQFQATDGGYVNADAGGYQMLLNYRGPARTFEIVSLMDVLQDRLPSDWGRDRIVLIGATAQSLRDTFATPYTLTATQLTSGVEIQANFISQILSTTLNERSLLRTWNDPLEWLWILAWALVGASLSWTLRLPLRTVLAIVISLTCLIGGTYGIFLLGWWIPLIPTIFVFVWSVIAVKGYAAILESRDRQLVMNLFERHVTPAIANAIWREREQFMSSRGRLRGQQMTATVLFTDLRGFTTLAEQLDPETLMSWLNEYMGEMARLVLERGGVVDKFIGDAVMAVFGVPFPRSSEAEVAADAIAAVQCAIAMSERLQQLNQKWEVEGLPKAQMRVGIATGTVITGSLGSAQRLEYTTLGDSVNIAARLESYDKALGHDLICRILINEETDGYVRNQFPTECIGEVMLRGRGTPTPIYQVSLDKEQKEEIEKSQERA